MTGMIYQTNVGLCLFKAIMKRDIVYLTNYFSFYKHQQRIALGNVKVFKDLCLGNFSKSSLSLFFFDSTSFPSCLCV